MHEAVESNGYLKVTRREVLTIRRGAEGSVIVCYARQGAVLWSPFVFRPHILSPT